MPPKSIQEVTLSYFLKAAQPGLPARFDGVQRFAVLDGFADPAVACQLVEEGWVAGFEAEILRVIVVDGFQLGQSGANGQELVAIDDVYLYATA